METSEAAREGVVLEESPKPVVAPPAEGGGGSVLQGGPVPAPGGEVGTSVVKKKRGRPRKYAPDGSVLSPMPISASIPSGTMLPMGKFTITSPDGTALVMKRGRGRPPGSVNKQPRTVELNYSLGELAPSSTRAAFMPHLVTFAAGEDVHMKIMSFSHPGYQAICILSANGVISNVTIRQPESSGGTLTYEGRFELLSLSGSFILNDNGGIRTRSGGMSVSLASSDGRVIGGAVAGLLVAASPVQVVIGCFMPNHQIEPNVQRQRADSTPVNATTAGAVISRIDMDESYIIGQGQRSSAIPMSTHTTPYSREDNWPSMHSVLDTRDVTDINVFLPGR